MKNVMIRFERSAEDRFSENMGPYEYVQLTYGSIDIGDGNILAGLNENGMWTTVADGAEWSDVVIFSAE